MKAKVDHPDQSLYWADDWFGTINIWLKLFVLGLFILFAYGIQYYYQDYLVPKVWFSLLDMVKKSKRK